MKAIRIHKHGGPEALKLETVDILAPREGEAQVKLHAIGVNYLDIYQRSGGYSIPLPFTPGNEGAGEVVTLGPGVNDLKVGDRVAWAGSLGSYAEYANVPTEKLAPLPRNVDYPSGAAVMLQGMTAHYLTHSTYPLKAGDTCLVHAAAGGMGLLLVQIAKKLGARVIGTVSTHEKAEKARSVGCDEVIIYTEGDWLGEVKRLTNNKGVQVIYDGVGLATFDSSLASLAPRGCLALYGQASGPVPPFDPQRLNTGGSLFLTRPSLAHHLLTREELLWRASDVLLWVASGELTLHIHSQLPLQDAPKSHELLRSRKTMGKLLLIP